MSSKKNKNHSRKTRQQPQWQPIGMLSTLAVHIDGMLESSQEQYETLQEAKAKPWVLDDSTVNRVIKVFTTQINDLWMFDEQLKRWAALELTNTQCLSVERLQGQMKKLREVDESVLALAKELAQGTIEKQMAKSDEQLGLEMMMRLMGGESQL